MYVQLLPDNTLRELNGNIEFSPTVYQTAESLTNEQMVEFNVYKVEVISPPSYNSETHIAERDGFLYNQELQRFEVLWKVRELTVDEKRSRVPSVVTMRQGRLAMLMFPYGDGNLLEVIDAGINSIPDAVQRSAAKIEWEYATEIQRDSRLLQQLTTQLGLTDEQLDVLFTSASSL